MKEIIYVFEGEVFPDKIEGRYIYKPFRVPNNIHTIFIEYNYKPLKSAARDNECIIDLGIFHPGTLDLIKGMKNFRGWSGSAKKKVFLSDQHATPGYIPGKIEPGMWNLILGLYKLPSGGCSYKVMVKLSPNFENGLKERSSVILKTRAVKKMGWVRGDFHVHSIHSDGDATIDEIVRRAIERKLDFVAVTDHNTFTQILEIERRKLWISGLLLIPGVEVTTYYGHMNVFGNKEPIEFRINSSKDMFKVVDYVKSKGYFPSVSHPKPLGPDWGWGGIERVGAMEVWQGAWEFNNYISLSRLDQMLSKGYRVSIIGGSDAHYIKNEIPSCIFTLGHPTTWVYVKELGIKSIFEAVKNRHVFISEKPGGPRINVKVETRHGKYMMGDVVGSDKAKITITVYGARNHLFRAVSTRGVEFYETIDKDVYRKILTVRNEIKYIRFETLREAPEPSEPYSEDNVFSSMSSPVFFE